MLLQGVQKRLSIVIYFSQVQKHFWNTKGIKKRLSFRDMQFTAAAVFLLGLERGLADMRPLTPYTPINRCLIMNFLDPSWQHGTQTLFDDFRHTGNSQWPIQILNLTWSVKWVKSFLSDQGVPGVPSIGPVVSKVRPRGFFWLNWCDSAWGRYQFNIKL